MWSEFEIKHANNHISVEFNYTDQVNGSQLRIIVSDGAGFFANDGHYRPEWAIKNKTKTPSGKKEKRSKVRGLPTDHGIVLQLIGRQTQFTSFDVLLDLNEKVMDAAKLIKAYYE